MCIPKPNHKKLVDDCYPSPKALVNAGPDFRPNSNELGRLTYYAENKPAKLTKVGTVLNSKAQTDSKAARASGPAADKGKAGLMITLGITKNLLSDCKTHINYFIQPAQSIILSGLDAALPTASRPRDLELSARAASCFYALASFIDPATTAVDKDFQKILKCFAAMSVERPAGSDSNGEDVEQRHRTRLIGLGALAGAVGSDAIYSSSSASLIPLLVPGLSENIKDHRVTLDWLHSEAKKASEGQPSYAEFNISRKPIAVRRTRSITAHVAGEKGPSTEDVISASIGILRGLLRHADALQVQTIVQNLIAWLDGKSPIAIPAPEDGRTIKSQWENTNWCCWLAQALCSWTPLQYRFVVLNVIVEHLVENCEGQATTKHLSLIEMARTVLTGQLSLIGLDTSETLSHLAALAVRRVYKDTRDSLLPPLVDCISGLGTHVYYADQINDIAEELAGRIAALQMPDVAADDASFMAGVGKPNKQAEGIHVHMHRQRVANSGPAQRDESIRVLLFCLMGVLHATHQSSGEIHQIVEKDGGEAPSQTENKGKNAADEKLGLARTSTRNRVSLSSLLSTANLLASPNHAVRLAYAQTLITLFRDEVEREQLSTDSLALLGAASVHDKVGESIGFVHALAAAVHVLCLSKSLTVSAAGSQTLRESPLELLPQLDRLNGDTNRPESLSQPLSGGDGADTESTVALPIDYVATAQALEHLIKTLPCTSALALTPMAVALDKDAGNRLQVDAAAQGNGMENHHRISSRMVAARVLIGLGDAFGASSVSKLGQGVLSQIPSLSVEPAASPAQGLTLPPQVVTFSAIEGFNGAGQSSSSSSPVFKPSSIIDGLSSSDKLQSATRLDSAVLKRWLERDWNVGIAVDEAQIGASPFSGTSMPSTALPSRRPSYAPINGGGTIGGTSILNGGTNASQASVALGRKSLHIPANGIEDLRDALLASSARSPTADGSMLNGHTQDTSVAGRGDTAAEVAERRASRRESRRAGNIAGPAALIGVNGSNPTSAVAILDSLKVGKTQDPMLLGPDSTALLSDNHKLGTPTLSVSPPYAA